MSDPKPHVAVVILNWNGLHYLKSFLGKVCDYSRSDAEIWVVDNASTDDSLDFIRENYPEVQLLVHDKNYGFAEGYNLGLKQISADYYVLLNSDVEVTSNWIPPVVRYMDSDPLMAAVQPVILDQRQKNMFEHAGAAGGYIDANGFPFCAGRIFDHFEEDHGQYSSNTEVFWASGAALFIRAELYHQSGGLDADFFAHMEEIDLCWRLKNQGYKIGACRESKVYHVGGGTLNKLDPKKTFLNFRNNLFLLAKNDFRPFFLVRLIWRMLLDGIAAMRFLTERKGAFFYAVFRAHMSFYKHFAKTWHKRLALKDLEQNPNNHGLFRGSILVWYFLKGRKKWSDLPSDLFN